VNFLADEDKTGLFIALNGGPVVWKDDQGYAVGAAALKRFLHEHLNESAAQATSPSIRANHDVAEPKMAGIATHGVEFGVAYWKALRLVLKEEGPSARLDP
jgi:hypothetical protein